MARQYKAAIITGQQAGRFLNNIRAISLDLDDTLWAVEPVIRRAEAELWQWLTENYPRIGERYSAPDIRVLRNRIVDDYPEKAHDFRFLRKRLLGRLAVASGYPEAVADDAFEVFDAARNRVELFPDVLPALARLSERYVIVALTNGNANLEKIGIHRYFAGTVSAADTGAAKPAPQIFHAAAQHVSAAPEDVLHVGDHPELDVAGAADAGMRTAWVNRNGAEWPKSLAPPDATVECLAGLAGLLEETAGDRR